MATAKFLGHDSQRYERARWVSTSGRVRVLLARWRADLDPPRWECVILGFGLQSRRFFAGFQAAVIFNAKLDGRLWGGAWRFHSSDARPEWDGVPDSGLLQNGQRSFAFGVDGSVRALAPCRPRASAALGAAL